MTIKNFSIEYDAINSRNTFTNGDVINGRIILETSKETKIKSLVFIGKGKAKVRWDEYYGQYDHRYYWADEKYYEVKQHILREARQDGSEVVGQGRHVFPFTFKIPDRKLPSSFKASTGKIVHKLKAELKQSMKLTKKASTYFEFVSSADRDIPGLMDPQYDSKDKSIKMFGSGNVSMDVHTDKMGYKQGGALKVTTEIRNNSSRSVKPKFILYEKQSFFAQGHRRLFTHDILKEKGEAVEAGSGQKAVTKVITIPRDLLPSITNCSIIKLEYRLKVQLDIKYTSDPVIKLPIVIMPKMSGVKQPHDVSGVKQPHDAAKSGFEEFGEPEYPAWNALPQPAAPRYMDPPPPYGACAIDPSISFDKL